MSALGVIASVIAAVASVTGLVVGLIRARRRRLIEIVDLLGELKQTIDYNGWIPGPNRNTGVETLKRLLRHG